MYADRADLVIEPQQSNLIKHRGLDELVLPVKRSYINVDMDPVVSNPIYLADFQPKNNVFRCDVLYGGDFCS